MNNIFLGQNPLKSGKKAVSGGFVEIDGEKYYEIRNYDHMQPFFISIASDSNHWMYISSTGGLTAGRKNPDTALFPYYTDDKISESSEKTGPKTILNVLKNGKNYLWEPFSDFNKGIYDIERTIAKNTIGNKLIFCEKNIDLDISFCYKWMNSDKFGWIRKCTLINHSQNKVGVYVVDGFQNVLPSGIDRLTQNIFSTLVDGYKKTELISNAGIVLFRMESILVDRAEPSESLKSNTIWNYGLENCHFLLSNTQLTDVRNGYKINPEKESKGVRGAIFACADVEIKAKESKNWYFISEVSQDIIEVHKLIDFIENTKNIPQLLEQNVNEGTMALRNIVAQVDGIQNTADENAMARHFSNVLFNTMRGGIYSEGYTINSQYFAKHILHFNRVYSETHKKFLSSLPPAINYQELQKLILNKNDNNLYRLFLEYLPLTFSRRHGDPSRPWNLFNINIKDENGDKLLSYQGNWRDIFQNWEALSLSYPGYINGIIAKFLNATTADGYNPYKVTNEGIEWELIEPENPWSNIGYWGDHQIIYLLKLMELSRKHYPEALCELLNKEIYAFANVPYRLKTYDEIVNNPKNSIYFDEKLHNSIMQLIADTGADAKLITDTNKEVKLVTFTEKILVTLLTKLSNFIPEAGIWMNTLRPEWNDANNALVGTGASMVTLYYLRRFIDFTTKLYTDSDISDFSISGEVYGFYKAVSKTLTNTAPKLKDGFTNNLRREVADELGLAGEKYRSQVYTGFSAEKNKISKSELLSFFETTLQNIDQSIRVNKRKDNLYHAYNLVSFKNDTIEVRHLYEMLEGQVAVLSAGILNSDEAVSLLNTLRNSTLYRKDQNSYILYPDKKLPSFLEKNNIESTDVHRIGLLTELVRIGDKRIINVDVKGQYHFNASFNNADVLNAALNKIRNEGKILVENSDIELTLELYEKIFDHQSFTGRSGTFYKYEGLGCIYWHMVSKLLLAVAENISWALEKNTDKETINKLKAHYTKIKSGIGAHKSPVEYGSFPFDPYSHTPSMAGVQQPGMTGQVKEDIISRYFELGIVISNGQLTINPENINFDEFKSAEISEQYSKLSFSYCSIPFEYIKDGKSGFDIVYTDNDVTHSDNYVFNKTQSELIFSRTTNIFKIIVHFAR